MGDCADLFDDEEDCCLRWWNLSDTFWNMTEEDKGEGEGEGECHGESGGSVYTQEPGGQRGARGGRGVEVTRKGGGGVGCGMSRSRRRSRSGSRSRVVLAMALALA